MGAEWSPNLKKYYVKNRNNYHKFKKWIIGDENAVSIISKYLYILEEIVTCKNCHKKTSLIINAVKDLYIIEKSKNGISFNNFNTTENLYSGKCPESRNSIQLFFCDPVAIGLSRSWHWKKKVFVLVSCLLQNIFNKYV